MHGGAMGTLRPPMRSQQAAPRAGPQADVRCTAEQADKCIRAREGKVRCRPHLVRAAGPARRAPAACLPPRRRCCGRQLRHGIRRARAHRCCGGRAGCGGLRGTLLDRAGTSPTRALLPPAPVAQRCVRAPHARAQPRRGALHALPRMGASIALAERPAGAVGAVQMCCRPGGASMCRDLSTGVRADARGEDERCRGDLSAVMERVAFTFGSSHLHRRAWSTWSKAFAGWRHCALSEIPESGAHPC